ncbi:hypothetical protein WR25_03107 [Diploscapter pachys]|uniref:Uncharacterized protein n=1 Tax=Diploscapter pachys TaxID=2018661 RepID=A0A2A2JG40_9BILA|nr:hypothetical protein WR25_03107 [Diploscapter pachys]
MAQNEDLEQLAFTNRKFWHLIKLTHSSAVVPKQLAINKMSIQPSRYNKKEYDLTIVCTGQSSHEFKVRGCFRHSIYSRQHDVTDIRVFNIFRNYIRYCKNAANENVDEVLSWDVYCFTESRKIPNMPVKGTPSIRLRWLFSKTIVENLCINNCNRAQFWQILMCLDNPGLIAYRKRIACKDLLLPPEDKEFFMRMLFLRQGVEFIEMRTPAFFEEMMVMPQFFDTVIFYGFFFSNQQISRRCSNCTT